MIEIEAEFGEILLIIDEVYSEMHKFKFMGFKFEAKKSLKVISTLIDSISLSLKPIMQKIKETHNNTLESIMQKSSN